ncbi:Acyl-CoA synthetase ACTT5 [Exophiala dermatitidis]
MLNSLHQFYHLYLRPGLHICELESMPQKSIFSLSIPPTDLLTYLFPPDATPSDQPLYISADQPTSHFLSQAETLVWVKQLALGFQKLLGLTGDRKESNVGPTIMILSPNHVFVPVVYLAAIAAGGIFCGCSVSFGVREVTYQLQNAAAEVFLVHPKFLDVALQAAQNAGLSGDKIFLLDQDPHPHGGKPDFRTILASREEARHWQWKKLDQEQAKNTTAVINYSSGTTGLPKGVRISHTNLVANVSQSIFMRDLEQPYSPSNRPRERWLGFLPLSHAYGQLWTILAAMKTQSSVYIMGQFQYVRFLQHIQTHKITHLQTAPPVLVMLAKRPETEQYDISSLRNILSGAAPLSRELQNEVTSKLNGGNVVQTWGMTEVTCSALHIPGGRDDRSGSVGYIDPNCEIKLLDDAGVEVGVGERGEIHIRGPNVCQGYWRNEKATRELFDQDGFMQTGDIAVRNEEGLYWIVDRKKELIKVKGLQVAPAELEAALLEHDGVADAAVVGVKIGPHGDEAPRAYVVLKERVKGSLTPTILAQWLDTRVAKHKRLTGGVVFVDEVPKSPTGKILRKVIREWAAKEAKVSSSTTAKL